MTYPISSYLKTMYLHNKSISKYSNINFNEIINQIQIIVYTIYKIHVPLKKTSLGKLTKPRFFNVHWADSENMNGE